ncbi:MAG TPA: HAD-IIA family hydrolase, partial [Candidatus Polarisedimenticolia bacterium]|nr:HAD-IIA family hydrolase [Candidatus Polarisedimenticolia bacterium]
MPALDILPGPPPRGLLVDIDGTLLDGERAIPGAVEALRRLRARQLEVRLLTNTSRRGRADIGRSLRGLGFDLDDAAILTPALLARRLIRDAGASEAALFVTPEARADLDGVEDTRRAPHFVVLGDLGDGFTHQVLSEVFRLVRGGATLVALHRNPWWTPGGGAEPVLDVGAYTAAIEHATGAQAHLVGKPAAAFFALALGELGLPAGGVVVVGDDAEADGRGGLEAGCRV